MKRILTLAVVFVFACSFIALIPGAEAYRRDAANLEIIYRKADPDPMITGEYADVSVKVRNKGTAKAEDVSLELVPEFPFSVDPDKDTERYFGDIYPGDEYHATFTVRVDRNAVPGENDLRFRTETELLTLTRNIPVEVRTREAVLSVEEVKIEDGSIPPSKTRDVTFTLKNRADTYLRSIGMSLGLKPEGIEETDFGMEAEFFGMEDFETAEEIPMITVGQTTEERISQMAPGEEKDVTFSIRADHDADEETYKVPIALRFESERYRKNRETGQWEMSTETFHNQEFTGIRVDGKPILGVGFAGADDYPIGGTKRDVSIEIINRGFSEAKFLDIELLPHGSYEIIGEPSMYIGHMSSDDYDSPSFEMYLNPEYDEVEIPVELKYKDNEENIIVENQTVGFKTYTWDELDRLGVEREDGILIYVVILIVFLAALYYYRRHCKKKKESLLEEK